MDIGNTLLGQLWWLLTAEISKLDAKAHWNWFWENDYHGTEDEHRAVCWIKARRFWV